MGIMIPLAWYAIGTLACWTGFALVWVGQGANRGHAACERLAIRAVREIDGPEPMPPGIAIRIAASGAGEVARAFAGVAEAGNDLSRIASDRWPPASGVVEFTQPPTNPTPPHRRQAPGA